ncbi:Enolase [subsurface metagenome]
MPEFTITKIKSRWILDSRGNPTVETEIYSGDVYSRAAVPSGASTGSSEALELRDGTENKSKLGANAILSVSLATAKLAATLQKIPLFTHLYQASYNKSTNSYLMPIPCSNILNGGKHAGNALAIQEFMILPIGAKTFDESIQFLVETYHTMKDLLMKEYGKNSINVGDEGGFAPSMQKTTEALDIIVDAINSSGFTPGIDFVLGLDAAASEFYKDNAYHIDGKVLDPNEMIQYYINLVEDYPIKLIEDPFDEKAFDSFRKLTKNVNNNVIIVDDDITVTNVKILEKAISMEAGNALLLKVNQIGTLTEAIHAAKMAFNNDFNVVVSHRSGETEDTFIADLAVGLCTGLIKTGAPCRTDRNAKYNQLLRIEGDNPNIVSYPSSFNDWKKYQ